MTTGAARNRFQGQVQGGVREVHLQPSPVLAVHDIPFIVHPIPVVDRCARWFEFAEVAKGQGEIVGCFGQVGGMGSRVV